jgi:hypothetical protein
MSYMTMNLPRGIYRKIDNANATAHSARQTIAYLKEFFDTRVVEFSTRSLDLKIMDHFIYPHLKNTVFRIRLLEMFRLT